MIRIQSAFIASLISLVTWLGIVSTLVGFGSALTLYYMTSHLDQVCLAHSKLKPVYKVIDQLTFWDN